MTLRWFGTAALLLDGIAFDPFLGIKNGEKHPERPSGAVSGELTGVSHVFVTHGHFDHIVQIPAICKSGRAPVHATGTPLNTLMKAGFPEERLSLINAGSKLTVGELEITAYQGRHCKFDRPIVLKTAARMAAPENVRHSLRLLSLNRKYRENGEILFYEISSGGKRLQIMGSMGLSDDVDYPVHADCLVMPFQGRSDADTYALSLIDRLEPERVLLDHYDDTFPPMTAPVDTTGICRILSKRRIECTPMEKGKKYII